MKTMLRALTLLLCLTLLMILIPEAFADSDEYAIFPASRMEVNCIAFEQENDNYSGARHGDQNAIDIINTGGRVFAPFTGTITYTDDKWGYVTLQSQNKVHWADGSYDYMTVGFMHDSDIDDLYVGKVISQGTPFYDAGGKAYGDPNMFGSHVHISVHKGCVNLGYTTGAGDQFAFNAFFVDESRTEIVRPGRVFINGYGSNIVYYNAPTDYTGLWKNLSSAFNIRSSWPCDLTLQTNTTNVEVWTKPGNTQTYSDSRVIGRYTGSGMTMHATKIIENGASVSGHYWYETVFPATGQTGYVWYKNVDVVSQDWTVNAVNPSKPTRLDLGQWFGVSGALTTCGSIITEVQGFIYPGNSITGTPVTASDPKYPNATSCDLSIIDESMRFDAVTQPGYYTYVVKVKLKNAKVANNSLSETTTDWVVLEETRSYYYVGNPPTLYTLTLDPNGGICSTGNIQYESGNTLGDLPTPMLNDTNLATKDIKYFWYFDGWYTAKTGGSKVTKDTAINGNMTVYAHWIKNNSFGKISFDAQGGSFERVGGNEASSYTYHNYETGQDKSYSSYAAYLADNKYIYSSDIGGRYYELPIPTKAGYAFVGWSTPYGRICEFDTSYEGLSLTAVWTSYSDAVPSAVVSDNGHTYKLFEHHMSWPDAEALCQAQGGHLVSITSQQEQELVYSLASQGKNKNYYIGATDVETEGSWQWTTGEDFIYSHWDTDYPEASHNTDENYGLMVMFDNPPNKQPGEWIDIPSAAMHSDYQFIETGFICELYDEDTITGTLGNLSWSLDNAGVLTVSGSGKMNDLTAYADGTWLAYNDSITSIQLENGITNIGDNAFLHCYNATSVVLPSTVESIGEASFAYCTKLSNIEFPMNLRTIGFNAFGYCTNLASIIIPSGVTSIGDSAFYGCENLQSVTIPTSMVSLGNQLFINCYVLDDVYYLGTRNQWAQINGAPVDSPIVHYAKLDPPRITAYANFSEGIHLLWSSVDGADCYNVFRKIGSGEWENVVTQTSALSYTDTDVIDGVVYTYDVNAIGSDGRHMFARSDPSASISILRKSFITGTWGDNLFWSLDNDGLLVISGEGGMDSLLSLEEGEEETRAWRPYISSIKSVVIKPGVTGIGDEAFRGCNKLERVTIPEGVKSIGWRAFEGCSSLWSMAFPESLTSIDYRAFWDCNSLTSVEIPAGVTDIGYTVFSWCGELKNITVNADNQNYASQNGVLYNKEKTNLICCPAGTVGEYEVPESVTSISNYAFAGCGNLERVIIPEGVETIGDCAFEGCTALTVITIPVSVTSIHSFAFFECSGLTDIYYAGTQEQWNIIRIGEYNYPLSSAIVHYADSTYMCADGNYGGHRYALYSGSKKWSDAKSYCESMGGHLVTITSAEEQAFIESLNTDDLSLWIGGYRDSQFVWHWVTGEAWSYTHWGDGEPNDSTAVVSDENCLAIWPAYWNDLNDLNTYETNGFICEWDNNFVGTWGNLTWRLDEDGTLIISGFGSMDDFSIPAEGQEETRAWLPHKGSIKNIEIKNGVSSIGNGAFYNCGSLTNVTIPESITSIGDYSFYSTYELTKVNFPSSLESIGEGAFCDCGLTNLQFPTHLELIGDYAFVFSNNLTNVTIPASVKTIGDGAFDGCHSLMSIVVDDENQLYSDLNGVLANKEKTEIISYPAGKQGSFVIPSSVTGISHRAFAWCSELTSITIPISVTSIGEHAFSGSGLSDVYYQGTKAQWGAIKVDTNNDVLLSARIHYIPTDFPDPDFILPTSLTTIEEEAFAGGTFVYIKLPENAISIGWHAFADCPNLAYIYIPALTTQIDEAAFGDLQGLTILGKAGSTAETYAQNHHFNFTAVP